MGHAADLALGIALAQPQRTVVCLNGDGSMLMFLGTLAVAVGTKAATSSSNGLSTSTSLATRSALFSSLTTRTVARFGKILSRDGFPLAMS
ncbi:MAG: hypothetical protein GWP12_03415, partial [Nitrospirae bacterium]|nr:hypothetical protein [Nitrospirota bacterium]